MNHELRHTVQVIQDGEVEVVVSKAWNSKSQRWDYKAEPVDHVKHQINLTRSKAL